MKPITACLSAARSDGRQEDVDLVEACLEGRQRAWDALVDRYSRLVYSVPRRCGLSESDADDVVQSVFIALFRALPSLRDGRRLTAWLLTTAHRESWRVSRQRKTFPELDRIFALTAPPDARDVARAEQQQMVREALKELGGRDEALLTALFAEPGPPDYEVIAEKLGMKVGSIGPTRARAFRKLEQILLRLGFDADEVAPHAATAATG